MCTLGEMVRYYQPDVYDRLYKMREVKKIVKPKEVKINGGEVERLMRHDSYERVRGALRQVRRT